MSCPTSDKEVAYIKIYMCLLYYVFSYVCMTKMFLATWYLLLYHHIPGMKAVCVCMHVCACASACTWLSESSRSPSAAWFSARQLLEKSKENDTALFVLSVDIERHMTQSLEKYCGRYWRIMLCSPLCTRLSSPFMREWVRLWEWRRESLMKKNRQFHLNQQCRVTYSCACGRNFRRQHDLPCHKCFCTHPSSHSDTMP